MLDPGFFGRDNPIVSAVAIPITIYGHIYIYIYIYKLEVHQKNANLLGLH